MARLERDAFIAPVGDGFCVVLDRECDQMNDEIIQSLGLTLSVRLATPTLAALNADDDLLVLWLFDGKGNEVSCKWNGALRGWTHPRAALVELARETFGTRPRPASFEWASEPLLRRLLFRLVGQSCAVTQHGRFLEEAGLPDLGAGMGFNYADGGELDGRGIDVHRVRGRIIRPFRQG